MRSLPPAQIGTINYDRSAVELNNQPKLNKNSFPNHKTIEDKAEMAAAFWKPISP